MVNAVISPSFWSTRMHHIDPAFVEISGVVVLPRNWTVHFLD